MKATVEFEVTGCMDCVLLGIGDYDTSCCQHPKAPDECDVYVSALYSQSYPDWCPILGEKK